MSFKEKMITDRLDEGRKIVRISAKKISEVESSQNVVLPAICRRFLEECDGGLHLFTCGDVL